MMEIISSKRFILLTLATSSLLTSNSFCTDELMMPHLLSKENYDQYAEPREIPKGEKERSINFQELKDWGPKNVIKMSTATVKMPHSAAHLPLRFGRNVEASILSPSLNLPKRFGRTTTARGVAKTPSSLLQGCTHSLAASELLYAMTCQHQDTQHLDQKWPRRCEAKETDGAEGKDGNEEGIWKLSRKMV